MEETCIVIFSKPWAMTDDRTKEQKEGITIEYLMTDNLKEPCKNEDGSRGVRHCKQSIPISKLVKIKEVPAIYKLRFGLKVNSKGKPEIKLEDLDYVSKIS